MGKTEEQEETQAATETPILTPEIIEAQLKEMRSQIEGRIEVLDAQLAGVDSLIAERNELKGSLAIILRVIDPAALPKRTRRSRAQIEAEAVAAQA